VIGVTSPDEGGWTSWICTRYLLNLAGAKALRITPLKAATIDEIDGLILGGGADIHPSHYKGEILPAIKAETQRVSSFNLRYFLSIFLWLVR
jgi:putative glutamine amidotransferase